MLSLQNRWEYDLVCILSHRERANEMRVSSQLHWLCGSTAYSIFFYLIDGNQSEIEIW